MQELILEALFDTLKMLPFLLFIYIAIEFFSFKYGTKLKEAVYRAGRSGPAFGAVVGSFPQCGFSVITTALFSQRLVTLGTLISVYLATSDEAIPIIFSEPGKAHLVFPLILTKIIIALIAGFSIDYFLRKKNQSIFLHAKSFLKNSDDASHDHGGLDEQKSCCGQTLYGNKKEKIKKIIVHPIIHTLKILLYIFTITLAINLLIFYVGEESLGHFISKNVFIQPVAAAIIGLIPNCASSVVVTEFYLKGLISYGSVIAGLSASGGLGILVLFKEEKSKKALKIVGLLFLLSVLSGFIIEFAGFLFGR